MSNTQTTLTQKLNIIATAKVLLHFAGFHSFNSFIINFLYIRVLSTMMMINLFLQLFTFQESSGDQSHSPFSSQSQYRSTLDRSSHRPGAGNNVMSEIKGGGKVLKTEQLNLEQCLQTNKIFLVCRTSCMYSEFNSPIIFEE